MYKELPCVCIKWIDILRIEDCMCGGETRSEFSLSPSLRCTQAKNRASKYLLGFISRGITNIIVEVVVKLY